jgi:hypothetical protein
LHMFSACCFDMPKEQFPYKCEKLSLQHLKSKTDKTAITTYSS